MSVVWPPTGPLVHDDLSDLSTAELAEPISTPPPPLDAEPPIGWTELVDGRGVYLRMTESVEPVTGPDAWYVHGLAGSSTNWTSLAGLLSEHARGFLIDLPGFGRSDPPPRSHYRLSDSVDVLAQLIRRRSAGPVHLVGNSLGGMVSALLAGRHPQLLASLTLISPAVPDLRITTDRGADPRLAALLLPGTAGVAVRRLGLLSPLQRARGMAELCFGDASSITDEQFSAAAADLAWRTSLPWVHMSVVAALRALMTSYVRENAAAFARAMKRVSVPTLVIWGTRDRLVDPRLAARTASAFADSRLLMLRGVGHAAQMEDPATTARALMALWRRVADFSSSGVPHVNNSSGVATSTA